METDENLQFVRRLRSLLSDYTIEEEIRWQHSFWNLVTSWIGVKFEFSSVQFNTLIRSKGDLSGDFHLSFFSLCMIHTHSRQHVCEVCKIVFITAVKSFDIHWNWSPPDWSRLRRFWRLKFTCHIMIFSQSITLRWTLLRTKCANERSFSRFMNFLLLEAIQHRLAAKTRRRNHQPHERVEPRENIRKDKSEVE